MEYVIIQFPGSNCDEDLYYVLSEQLHLPVVFIDYRQTELPIETAAVLIPGGFSYGDYLRAGAIARFAPIMTAIKTFAATGRPVIGICNGFQILTEAGLLPGALRHNDSLDFICRSQNLIVENTDTRFTSQYKQNANITLPIAHGEGNYYCDEKTLAQLRAHHQIIFTYQKNPNGSVANIAGIVNQRGNVLGMMPHPERASEAILGSTDGLKLFESLQQSGC
ncbi:phosphoribosylformylglycinamidine synthase [Paucilactobacillus hokkaidonensis JCM 18461]|uniref:Phosphoribosylformylglycinamidine synthase subunit PurQ n=2 Tax=Paucilactobacillus hokkaidonensis TaxID=1193095 RepID=A0A0A1GXM1_9LACO|nr:phosphoribosylformylglycinamidine synthase subunit PurQ [Paucilactobacillus hokkaidonensis]KRO10632.1 phosphoribosylformylglycinamidine synthase domain-containing protein [Paucilactobacillus hokkaidonensis]BAP85624.1 phosphoribosylformylglycinamidine synthase [Paucilactobacillus hokkaidonensis JCM 18461]